MSMGGFLMHLTVAFFVIVGVGTMVLTNRVFREHALEEATSKSELILDHNLAIHTYFSNDLKPSLFEFTEPFRDEEYFDPTWMSSTFAVREIDEYFQQLNPADYYYKEAAVNARNPKNEADAFEKSFLEELNQDPDLTVRTSIREINGQRYFTVLRRGEMIEGSCLGCHSQPDVAPLELVEAYGDQRSFQRQVGEIVSAISIRIPLDDINGELGRLSWLIPGFMTGSLVLLFGALNLVRVKVVTNPLEKISEKARLISGSSRYLGETIKPPVFREMRKLTDAFNTMSIALREERDLLEERVKARTAELQEANQRIEYMAQHDALTGLPNRRLFEEHMDQAVKLARRDKLELSLMVADLDDFKEINDNYGHAAGDHVLLEVGQRISRTLRESDLVARWGGDEFTFLLFDTAGKEDLRTVAEKIFSVLKDPVVVEGEAFEIKMSIGVASFPRDGESLDVLVKGADAAMYKAKDKGGNTCWCSSADWE